MISLYINNLPSANKVISSLGNSVTVNLNQPILLDEKKKYHLRLLQANIVYCTPNIFTNVNNKLTYTYGGTDYTMELTQGLYGLSDINSQIAIYTSGQGQSTTVIEFVADPATSKIYLVIGQPNIVVKCGAAASILPLLGFPAYRGNITNGTSVPYYTMSTNQANLNSIQNIYVKCDIVTGSYLNSQTTNIVASIIPNVSPYSTIQYTPQYPTRLPITVTRIDSITFTLVDDSNKDIDIGTNGGTQDPELWSILITIEPDELLLNRTANT